MIESVYVETSSKCNLSCTYCYRSNYQYPSKNQNMQFSLFEKLIADFKQDRHLLFGKRRPNIFLHSYGEPTLNPYLTDMIHLAANEDIFNKIRFVSNLLAIAPEQYHNFFKAGLDGLYISLDTLDPPYIEKTRCGTNLPRLLSAIKILAHDYAQKLIIITVLSSADPQHLADVGNFLKDHGIAMWNIQLLNTRKNQFSLDSDTVSKIKAGLIKKFADITINFEEECLLKCRQPFTTLAVNALGYLTPCCSMTNNEIENFGCIQDDGTGTLYFGKHYKNFRQQFRSVRPQACMGCPYY